MLRSMSYVRALQLAIHRFHRSSFNREAARSHLSTIIATQQAKGKFNNSTRLESISSSLELYMQWAADESLTVVESMLNLGSFEEQSGLPLGGIISRVDLLPTGGYRAVLFGSFDANWKSQLRMPLIQLCVSRVFERPLREVLVAVQFPDGSGLDSSRYPTTRVEEAERQLLLISQTLDQFAGR